MIKSAHRMARGVRPRGLPCCSRFTPLLAAVCWWLGCLAPMIGEGVGAASGFDGVGVKVYYDSSHSADALLRSAENHARAGNHSEAIEILQRVAQQFGDKVVEVVGTEPGSAGESRLSINARREVQRRIALMPPAARALYRARVDPQAERWYRQGAQERDRTLLRRVIDEAFCSSWGDDALDLLGDLAFQDGRFAEALAAYGPLAPGREPGGAGLVHPDPSVDLTRVDAKILLCRAAIGEHPPTAEELTAFAQAHPDAAGPFAGRRGPVANDLAEAVTQDHLGPAPQADGRWPTFAGSATRGRVAPGPIDVGSLQWRVDLDPPAAARPPTTRSRGFGYYPTVTPPAERLLVYHPIVVGDQVLVANDRRITAYDLNLKPGSAATTGVVQPEVAWKTQEFAVPPPGGRGPQGVPRYTLTAAGSRVFARMGPPPGFNFATLRMQATKAAPSSIVAIDRAADGKQIWKKEADEIPLPKRPGDGLSQSAAFEGSPIADERSVYVDLTDRAEMTATYVVCFDAADGTLRWIRYVCEANANIDPFASNQEIAHRLLTLDGPTIYYQTNLGALAAIDAGTGGVLWLATYPWAGRNAGGMAFNNGFGMGMPTAPAPPAQQRDLNPAVVHDGLVVIAPDETPHLFAFHAATGLLAWKSEALPDEAKLAHVLGVAKGHLIATGDRVLWFDIKTGKLAHAWPDKPLGIQGFGRGLLAGDRIYWPTKSEIHILDQATGLRAEAPIRLEKTYGVEGGNLAVGDGYLVVAQAGSMAVFCQNSRLIQRYRDEIARAPDDALNYFRLAQAAEAIGQEGLALESLDQALPRARNSETIDGVPLAEATTEHRRRLLMKLGGKARAGGDWAEAARQFRAAARAAAVDRDRLAAHLELAEVHLAGGDAPDAVRTWQSLLADERLRGLPVDATDGHRTVRADLQIADRLMTVLTERGRGLYAEFDRAAADLLARGRARRDPRLLEDLARSYPAAQVVAESNLALGKLYAELGRPGDSASAFKRLTAGEGDDLIRARAWWGLARAFEAQKLWIPAREAFAQAAQLGPSLQPDDAEGRSLTQWVADHLDRPPLGGLPALGVEARVPAPLGRRWGRQWAGATRPLVAAGVPPSAEAARIFLVEGVTIRPIEPATGESPWTQNLGGEPVWVGYLADRVVAATRNRLVALALPTGAVLWSYDLAASEVGPVGPDPFSRGPVAPTSEPDAAAPGDFRIVDNRVFCLRGSRTLMAIDGETGLVDWSVAAPAGRFNPRLHAGSHRIAVQTREPNRLLILETATGRQLRDFPQIEDGEWLRDPVAVDDDHVAIVTDRTTVALLDLQRGGPSWVFRETAELPINGPPRILGDARRLLVLQDGRELIRLDPATGAKGWSRLLGPENLSERPEAIALGEKEAFVADDGSLIALRLRDGQVAWRRSLGGPTTDWVVALTERSVAAYPNLRRSAYQGASFPLVLRRRDDGELVQRLQFPANASDLAVRFSPRGLVVATSAGAWALGGRQVMDEPAPGR